MLIRPQHPEALSLLVTDLALPTLWVPKLGITQRGMGWIGGGCGCCDTCPYGGPPDCQAKPDGTVTWFSHEVDEETGEITRLDETNEDDDIAAAHRGPCYTVYVNSSSGDVAETGNGTEARPFVNLNTIFAGNVTKSGTGSLSSGVFTPDSAPTEWAAGRLIGAKLVLGGTDYEVTANTTTTATITGPPDDDDYSWTLKIFDDDCIYNICSHSDAPDNCPRVKVLVKGTIDYPVVGSRTYALRLHIEPWGGGFIVIAVASTPSITAVGDVGGVHWNHATVIATSTGARGVGCGGCGVSTFDDCDVTGSGPESGRGFYDCPRSACDGCTATGSATGSANAEGMGIEDCEEATFRSCTMTGTAVGTSASGTALGAGIYHSESVAIDDCDVTGEGEINVLVGRYAECWGYGLHDCHYSTLNGSNFTGTATMSEEAGLTGYPRSESYGDGIQSCEDSIINDCIAEGNTVGDISYEAVGMKWCDRSEITNSTGTGNSEVYWAAGFERCHHAIITNTDGTGNGGTGTGIGFYLNQSAAFDTCDGVGTGSDPDYTCGFLFNFMASYNNCTGTPSAAPCTHF